MGSWDNLNLLFFYSLVAVYYKNLEKQKHVYAISVILELIMDLLHSDVRLMFPYVCMKHTCVQIPVWIMDSLSYAGCI